MGTTIEIAGGPGEDGVLALSQIISLATSTSPNVHTAIGKFSLLVLDGTDGLRQYETADAGSGSALKYIVDAILLNDGRTLKPFQYLTAEEANSGNYLLRVWPIGGVKLKIYEDAVSDVITDAEAVAGYCELVVTAPTAPTTDRQLTGVAYADVKLDSSTASTTAGNLLMELLECLTMKPSATGLKRQFLCRVRSSKAQASQ